MRSRSGMLGANGVYLSSVRSTKSYTAIRRFRFTCPPNLVEIVAGETELSEQKIENLLGAVMRRFQSHRVAEAARGEFAFDGAQQIIDFFLLDEQVAVARDPELITAAHVHPGEQLGDEGLDDGAQEHEVAAAELVGQPDEARQGTRRLHHGETAVAAESVLAFDHDREVQALVENFRERPAPGPGPMG